MFYWSGSAIGILVVRLILDAINGMSGQIPDWNHLQYNMLTNIAFAIAFGALDIARAINRKGKS